MHAWKTVARATVAELSTTVSIASRWASGFGDEHVHLPAHGPVHGAVLLVHGFASNRSHFTDLEKVLLASGYAISSVNYPWTRTRLAEAGRHVAADAAAFASVVGDVPLHVVSHSLGGVVSRWALGNTSLGSTVSSLTTVGSPHSGTPLAHLAPRRLPGVGALLAQVRTSCADLADLPHPDDLPDVEHLAVAGTLDMVVPAGYARLPEAPNVRNVDYPAGHNSLLNHRGVAGEILDLLEETPVPSAA